MRAPSPKALTLALALASALSGCRCERPTLKAPGPAPGLTVAPPTEAQPPTAAALTGALETIAAGIGTLDPTAQALADSFQLSDPDALLPAASPRTQRWLRAHRPVAGWQLLNNPLGVGDKVIEVDRRDGGDRGARSDASDASSPLHLSRLLAAWPDAPTLWMVERGETAMGPLGVFVHRDGRFRFLGVPPVIPDERVRHVGWTGTSGVALSARWSANAARVFVRMSDGGLQSVDVRFGRVRWESRGEPSTLGQPHFVVATDGRVALLHTDVLELRSPRGLVERRYGIHDLVTGSDLSGGMALSPDEAHIAVGPSRGQVRVLTWPALDEVQIWNTLIDAPSSHLAWSPDGRRIASGNYQGGVTVWELGTKPPLTTFDLGELGARDQVVSMVFTNRPGEGERLLVAGYSGLVRSYDLSGQMRSERMLDSSGFDMAAFSPDGTRLAVLSGGQPKVGPVDGLRLEHIDLGDPATAFAWSPKGDRLAFVVGTEVRFTDARGQTVGEGSEGAPIAMPGCLRGSTLYYVDSGEVVSLDLTTSGAKPERLAHRDPVEDPVEEPDEAWPADAAEEEEDEDDTFAPTDPDDALDATSDDELERLLDAKRAELVGLGVGVDGPEDPQSRGNVRCLADNRLLVTDLDLDARLVDATSGRVLATLPNTALRWGGVVVSANGRVIMSTASPPRVWSVDNLARSRFVTVDNTMGHVSLSPDGAWALAPAQGMHGWEMRVTELRTGQTANQVQLGGEPFMSSAFSPDGKTIAHAGYNAIWLRRLADLSKVVKSVPLQGVSALAWLDGRHLVVGVSDYLYVLHAESGRLRDRIWIERAATEVHVSDTWIVAFGAQGATAISRRDLDPRGSLK